MSKKLSQKGVMLVEKNYSINKYYFIDETTQKTFETMFTSVIFSKIRCYTNDKNY